MLSFNNRPVTSLLTTRSYMHSSSWLILRNVSVTAAAMIVVAGWTMRKPIDASQLFLSEREKSAPGSNRDEVSKGTLISLIDMEGSNYTICKYEYAIAAITGACSLSFEKVSTLPHSVPYTNCLLHCSALQTEHSVSTQYRTLPYICCLHGFYLHYCKFIICERLSCQQLP